jgi:hypothetical protein
MSCAPPEDLCDLLREVATRENWALNTVTQAHLVPREREKSTSTGPESPWRPSLNVKRAAQGLP